MTATATGPAEPGPSGAPVSVDYSHIPFIPRRWLWTDVIPAGNPVMFAAAGGTGKGLLTCLIIARIVLGLPFPGEDQGIRRKPGRVVHIAGSEDDPFEDLAPRFRAAIAAAVAEFGLDPELAGERGAIRLIHDLSEWPDGSPFELPADMGRLAAEVARLNALGGPQVALVVLDPFADMLGQKDTISTVKGARAVLKPIKLVTRQLDIGLVIVHHLTKDGKVSGSPAVLDALRLAFIIARDETDESARVITNVKANISSGQAQRYRIAGSGPHTRAEFTEAADVRTQRVTRAAERAAEAPAEPSATEPLPGSRRARYAASASLPGAGTLTAGLLDDSVSLTDYLSRPGVPGADPGPFRVQRLRRPPGAPSDGSRDELSWLGLDYVTRPLARSAVLADCGAVLSWRAADTPRAELAGTKRADGSLVSYRVEPVS